MKIASFTQRAGAKDSARELGIVTERGLIALADPLDDRVLGAGPLGAFRGRIYGRGNV